MIDASIRGAWSRLEQELRPFIARRVSSPADADDVLQDVFLRMQRALPSLRDDERFGPWVYQVTRSAIAQLRRQAARHPLAREASPFEQGAEPTEASDAPDLECRLGEHIAPFVAALPSPYREALTLTELEGLTQKDAAVMLGISLPAMKSRILRGRERLRVSLEACCEIALDARGGIVRAPNPGTSHALGYSADEQSSVPEGANLGLGCGNPQAIAALRPGETVLDLGSGAAFDCFLAARQVGASGRVIGVDMTPQMVSRARENAQKVEARNVQFRLGEIERLPVRDASVDVVLSNCVINLSPDKPQVFREAFRVLRPGGRLAISDVVALRPIPDELRTEGAALSACVGGAVEVEPLKAMLVAAGFEQIQIVVRRESKAFIEGWMPGSDVGELVSSATIEAVKPGERSCCATDCCP